MLRGPPFDLPWRPAQQREEKLWGSVCPWVPRSRELKLNAQQVRGGSSRGGAPGKRDLGFGGKLRAPLVLISTSLGSTSPVSLRLISDFPSFPQVLKERVSPTPASGCYNVVLDGPPQHVFDQGREPHGQELCVLCGGSCRAQHG